MYLLMCFFFSFLGSMLVVGFPPFAVPASFIKCILLFITNCLWMNEINIIIIIIFVCAVAFLEAGEISRDQR